MGEAEQLVGRVLRCSKAIGPFLLLLLVAGQLAPTACYYKLEGKYDPWRCDPECPSGMFCREGHCVSLDAGLQDSSLETAQDGPASDGPSGADASPGAEAGTDLGPIVTPLVPGHGRLWLGSAAGGVALYSWNSTNGSWAAESVVPPVVGDVYWVVNRLSPSTAQEVAAIKSPAASGSLLQLVRWSGAMWTQDFNVPSAIAATTERDFDLARERLSEDLLLVYSDGGTRPVFRSFDGNAWSAPALLPINDGPGPLPDLTTGKPLWVQLVPRPASDEVTLLWADSDDKLAAIVWDGSSWTQTTAAVLETSLKTNPIYGFVGNRAFDGAYETQSGKLVVAWARYAGGLYYQVKPAGAGWGTAAYVSLGGVMPHLVDLASDPTSNRIAGAFLDLGDGTERLGLAVWDGSGWTDVGELDSQIHDVNDTATGDFPGAVAWVGKSGKAVCVYADDQAGTIDWAHWASGTGWVVQTDVAVTGKNYTESVILRSYANQPKVLAIISDSDAEVYVATFDGSTWVSPSSPWPGKLSQLQSVPFGFDLKP